MTIEEFNSKYLVNRDGTNSEKWETEKDIRFKTAGLLPMWVADMEFKAPDEVIEAMNKRVSHGVFGYTVLWDGYFEAFFDWQKKRYNIDLKKEWIKFSTGVVTSIYWLVNAFTQKGDSIIILTPVYYPFHNAVKDNDRNLIECGLKNDNGVFTIDFERLENDIVKNNVKMMIFCNPHNPVGRVWTDEEIDKTFDICKKHNVYIISDEIHQDINLGIRPFISALSIKNKDKYIDRLIVLTSASKTFNLACLLNSHIIIPDADMRKIYKQYVNTINRTELSVLGMTAAEAAYRYGEDWLDGLLKTIKRNYEYIRDELKDKIPDIIVSPLEGTYLPFIDLRKVADKDRVKELIQDDCKIAVDFGEWFSKDYKGFIRLNIATDFSYIKLFIERIVHQLKNKSYK
ncbi:bifunctional PLP-dependent enzyme with beta-cystathionase and maltose regulon repressor activities [Brachyspira hampsonii 30446]|uniref:cysteine-S-conjugate beta-lyase n=1 Tax=Brachyspira hampsonii 30446 TaxID=1289135 RepID=A0A2U4FHA7_9SPIR|nr:MalY/PatB family protein [Brachyspira hampsonii]EKV56581.1 bifunctional PLP-dependent enzyme with beta-cystathionase and maltose regulon repressor activities [Brachyspira hampsonii 30446]MBW5395411.1 pyridoxal phosphate-dependent aminotransferase [Brachyspira hampsonii]OEJ19632.1 aminotransferase [Brachyspira hampsonii]